MSVACVTKQAGRFARPAPTYEERVQLLQQRKQKLSIFFFDWYLFIYYLFILLFYFFMVQQAWKLGRRL